MIFFDKQERFWYDYWKDNETKLHSACERCGLACGHPVLKNRRLNRENCAKKIARKKGNESNQVSIDFLKSIEDILNKRRANLDLNKVK